MSAHRPRCADAMSEMRCGACRRKLAMGRYCRLQIKCPRCGCLNDYRVHSVSSADEDVVGGGASIARAVSPWIRAPPGAWIEVDMHGQSQTRRRAKAAPRIGSLFAGIGGFDLGFEAAGFKTAWQVEINPICRAVLADHFPRARRYVDVRECGAHNLEPVDIIVGGFPCQDLSVAGKRRGLDSERSGLFFEVVRILRELRPRWVVLENVTGLLYSGRGTHLQTVIESLAQCGYVGLWRVLDAQYFGVAQRRRRIFLVGGLGERPPMELLADAGAVEPVPGPQAAKPRREITGWPHPTLCAGLGPSSIALGSPGIVAVQGGRRQMAKRARVSAADGLCLGLDAASFAETHAAGNAIVPAVAEWVARHLMATF